MVDNVRAKLVSDFGIGFFGILICFEARWLIWELVVYMNLD